MNWKNENILIILSILILAIFMVNTFGGDSRREQNMNEMIYSDFIARANMGDIASAQFIGDSVVEGFTNDGMAYRTFVPPNDVGLTELLREKDVQLNYLPKPETPWYLNVLIHWGPFILIFAIWIFLMRRMQGGAGKLFSLGRSRAQRIEPDQHQVTFQDVAGADEAKEELKETIDFLKDPAKFRRLGGRIPKGVLMSGPPGTGKTLLAKAVAGEAGVPFYSISGSDFVEMFVGVGASRVRDLFEEGRRNAPCILFIDEIDAVGRSRGAGMGSGNDEREQTLNQLLVEMDGFDATEGIIVIASTNRPDVLDPALMRPGRFDRQVYVSLPDVRGREAILGVHAEKVKMASDVELRIIARGTPGFSGADLRNLINEAALFAARSNRKEVTLAELEWARDKVMMGPERKSMVMSEDERKTTAYHEAGHALVSALLPNADPIHKVTIIPRGRALGVTDYLPENDNRSYDVEYLSNRITIAMGGRAAEEVIFDQLTTGASNDIQQATETVRNMICRWGMNNKFGPIVLGSDEQQSVMGQALGKEREYSEDTAEQIDTEMRDMVKSHYEQACQLLRDNLDTLHQIAHTLLEEETIEGSRIMEMLGKPQLPKVEISLN